MRATDVELRAKRAAVLIPYVAVGLGLWVWQSAWAASLLYHLGAGAFVLGSGRWRQLRWSGSRPPPAVAAAVAAVGAGVGPVVFVMWSTVQRTGVDMSAELAEIGLVGAAWALFIVYYATVNPLVEELFWRGSLGSSSVRFEAYDFWFAGYHVLVLVRFMDWPWIAVSSGALLIAGWAWRQLAARFHGLAVPVLSHAVADASLISAVFVIAS